MIYVKVVNTATIEIEESELKKAGLTIDDLYGYPIRDLEDAGAEYQLEVEYDHWETTGNPYQWPKARAK